MQAKSRAFATEQIGIQMADFKRLGVLGDWEHPYRTMDFSNEADEIRAFKRVMERGFVYRGLKPVYWCFDCGSSLAEFEIEYADKKSTTLDVGFKCAEPDKLAAAFGLPGRRPLVQGKRLPSSGPPPPGPSRQPGAEPQPRARLRAGGHAARPAGAGRNAGRKVPGALPAHRHRAGHGQGRKAGPDQLPHPLHDVDAGYRRFSPVYLADYATADDGTGIVHSSPAYGVDDFNSCVANGIAYDDILNPVQGNGQLRARLPAVWRPEHLEGRAADHRGAAQRRPPVRHARHHPQLPALLAPQDAGDLPRGGPVVHPHGRGRRRFHQGQGAANAAPAGAGRDRADQLLPRKRQGPPARHDRRPARLVHQPPAQLGRAAALLPAQGHGELHPRTPEILDLAADMVQAGGIEAWSKATPRHPGSRSAVRRGCASYTKSSDILEVWFDSGTTHTTVLKGSHPGSGHDSGPEADLYLEGHDQHRGWFHSSLLTACAMYGRAPYKGLLTHGFTVDSQGRKMSKSLGNGVDPQETSEEAGRGDHPPVGGGHRLLGRHRR
jgi:isoleucyl-tRNA synthetase